MRLNKTRPTANSYLRSCVAVWRQLQKGACNFFFFLLLDDSHLFSLKCALFVCVCEMINTVNCSRLVASSLIWECFGRAAVLHFHIIVATVEAKAAFRNNKAVTTAADVVLSVRIIQKVIGCLRHNALRLCLESCALPPLSIYPLPVRG